MNRTPPRRPAPLYPQLRPRPKGPARELVVADQRARLLAAMVESVAERGYERTTVAHLCALAGVSKRTLYELFPDKHACFVASCEQVARDFADRVHAALREYGEGEPGRGRAMSRALDALARDLAQRPKEARLIYADMPAADAAGQATFVQSVQRAWECLIARELTEPPDGVPPPPVLARAVVSGLWHVARLNALSEDSWGARELAKELRCWMLCYRSPSVWLLGAEPNGPTAPAGPRRRARGQRPDARTRILRATAQLSAANGCLNLTGGQIAAHAGVDHDRLRELFEDVDECFLAALELLSAEALGDALHAAERAPDWSSSVCRAVASLMGRVADDPIIARVVFVEAAVAGPSSVRRREALLRSLAALLARRTPSVLRPSALLTEAIVGAVWGLVEHQVRGGRPRGLTALAGQAAYLVLAPIVGAQAAVEAILAEQSGRERRPRLGGASPSRVSLMR